MRLLRRLWNLLTARPSPIEERDDIRPMVHRAHEIERRYLRQQRLFDDQFQVETATSRKQEDCS